MCTFFCISCVFWVESDRRHVMQLFLPHRRDIIRVLMYRKILRFDSYWTKRCFFPTYLRSVPSARVRAIKIKFRPSFIQHEENSICSCVRVFLGLGSDNANFLTNCRPEPELGSTHSTEISRSSQKISKIGIIIFW